MLSDSGLGSVTASFAPASPGAPVRRLVGLSPARINLACSILTFVLPGVLAPYSYFLQRSIIPQRSF